MPSPSDGHARRLQAVAQRLLDPTADRNTLATAVADLRELCVKVTGFGLAAGEADLTETALPTGRALSPRDAAACLADPIRTAALIRGVDAAIRARRHDRPNRQVEIVYAGTGPFAPLVLPLLALFDPAELRVTLLDVHERSTEVVGCLVERLGLADRVRAVLAADATAYVHPTSLPLNIALVEVMQRSLNAEPQVAIARRLASQVDPDGILIPERVTVRLRFVELAAMRGAWEAGAFRERIPSAVTVMDLTRETALAPLDREGRYPPTVVTCPADAESGLIPVLFTMIDVYGGHAIGPWESGLTTPEPIWPLAGLRAGERVAAQYQIGPRPGLVWERLGEAPQEPLKPHRQYHT